MSDPARNVTESIVTQIEEAFNFITRSRTLGSPRKTLNALEAAEILLMGAREELMHLSGPRQELYEKNIAAMAAEISRIRDKANSILTSETRQTVEDLVQEVKLNDADTLGKIAQHIQETFLAVLHSKKKKQPKEILKALRGCDQAIADAEALVEKTAGSHRTLYRNHLQALSEEVEQMRHQANRILLDEAQQVLRAFMRSAEKQDAATMRTLAANALCEINLLIGQVEQEPEISELLTGYRDEISNFLELL